MSRIQIPSSCVANPDYEVWVGWDSPFESFFAQVYDMTRDEDERIIHWSGLQVGAIKTVTDLDNDLRDYAVIPEEIGQQLMDDYKNRTEPTELQKWGRNL